MWNIVVMFQIQIGESFLIIQWYKIGLWGGKIAIKVEIKGPKK